jgi:hypothetical protein
MLLMILLSVAGCAPSPAPPVSSLFDPSWAVASVPPEAKREAAPPEVRRPLLGEISTRLELGMTGDQVISVAGRRTDSAEQSTCGTLTPHPWSCRTWKYNGGGRDLTVTFQPTPQGWMVNS